MLLVEGEGFSGFEEASVEAQDVLAKDGGEAAGIHAAPEGFDHRFELGQIVVEAGEQRGEAVGREKMDVLGEEGKDAAHEEWRHHFSGVIFLKRAGEVGEVRSDIPGDAGGDAAGVEGERVGPDGPEAVAIAGAPVRRGGYGG